MPTFKGGDIPQSESASGIMVEGRTLEEVLDEEEARELGETMESDKIAAYHRTRARYADFKDGEFDPGRIYTRREINKMTWEKMLMSASTIDKAVLSVLLSGSEITGKELREKVKTSQSGITTKQYDMRMSYLMNQTDLGKIVERRRAGKGVAYKLVTPALDCLPEELAVFAYKKDEPRENVLAHHKGLKPYFEADETQAKSEPDPGQKPDISDLSKPGADINGAIAKVLSESLGVNVNVSGCIEIKFTFG